MKSFIDAYTEAPDRVKEFLYSDDFYSFFEEYRKKFEISDEYEVEFIYLLQDLAIKRFDLEKESLTEIIRNRLNYDTEKAKQLEYHIKTRFLPLVEPLWKEEKEETQKIKKEVPKEVIDLIQKAKEAPPQKILNLQKVVKTKEAIEVPKPTTPIDLSKLQQIKTEVPKSTIDIKQTISWEPPKPTEDISSKIVVIKKPKEEKKEGEVLDLSNL